jgi:hypothetical protein
MKSKEYWDGHFEERYKQRKAKSSEMPLKVSILIQLCPTLPYRRLAVWSLKADLTRQKFTL